METLCCKPYEFLHAPWNCSNSACHMQALKYFCLSETGQTPSAGVKLGSVLQAASASALEVRC